MSINRVNLENKNNSTRIIEMIKCHQNSKPNCYIENSGASLRYVKQQRHNYEFIIEILRYSNDTRVFAHIVDTGKSYDISVISNKNGNYEIINSSSTNNLETYFNSTIREECKNTEIIVLISVSDKIIDIIKKSIFFERVNNERIYNIDALIERDTLKLVSASFINNRNIRLSLQVDYGKCHLRMILLGKENKSIFACNLGEEGELDYSEFLSIIDNHINDVEEINVDYQCRINAINTLKMFSLKSIRNNICEDIMRYKEFIEK